MKKPIIGLTPSHNTENDDISMRPTYLRALTAAGAIPMVLPLESSKEDLEQLLESLDGILFVGGPDVHPFLFGEETLAACGSVSVPRDTMELSLLSLAMERRKPILGICRGIQLINIGLGGTIYQDLPSQWKESAPIAHQQLPPYRVPAHRIDIVKGSLLEQLAGAQRIQVNSMHHQAVKDLAPGLKVCGYGPNGLIEALEKPDYPYLLAVQWHPEHLWEQAPAARNIFQSFVKACGSL